MDIRMKATNIEMTTELSNYVNSRMEAVEKLITVRNPDDEVRFEVEVGRIAGHSKNGLVWFAEVNVISKHGRARAVTQAESINAAIDLVKDDLFTQVEKRKRKFRALLRRGGAAIKGILRQS